MADRPKPIARGARGRARATTFPSPKPSIPSQSAPPQNIRSTRPGDIAADLQHSLTIGCTESLRDRAAPLQIPAAQGVPRQQQLTAIPGAGGGGDTIGRGALRGRRVINPEILRTRPESLASKQGSGGKPIGLHANYFKLITSTDWCLYKYCVSFAPEEDRTVVRKAMMKDHKDTLGGYIFDGSTLYTGNRLPQPLKLNSKRTSDDTILELTVTLVGDMVKGDENYLQFFNIIMRKCLETLNLQLVGRNFYDAQNKVVVREYALELWPGYETSIRQHERGILMCTEIRHKVMRQQTVFDILMESYKANSANYKGIFSAKVIGLTVLTDYNNNTYRVDDVDYDKSPSSTFECKGEQLSYKDYYRQKYQINIKDARQPLLLSRSKSRDRRAGLSEMVYLVPELCRSTGITDAMREDRTMMLELSKHTRLDPRGRIDRLLSFNRRLQSQKDVGAELKRWNMELDTNLAAVPGRVLPAESIVFGGNREVSAGPEGDWRNALRNQRMLVMPPLRDWVVIVPSRFARDCQAFIKTLQNCVSGMRYEISEPRPVVINDDRASSYTVAIENVMSKANPQIIMCVLPNNRADRYSAIKKKCCIDRPVPTQCILTRNLSGKGLESKATKVGIQMNCKVGGAAWSVTVPLNGLMVAGFDVCHDTANKSCDFGALVASLDKGFSRYFSAVSAHQNGEELSNDLATNMCKAVHKYRETNNALPDRIVIYRDGVGDGQIPFVYEHEVENLKKKLITLYGDPSALKLAYIIVTKRLNTRLFFNGNNPPAGTIVDDVITNPNKYDFYVVSQFIKAGSVSPTGYSVISDNCGLDASKIQRLTFKLTHTYANWSGTVRVPAPCQYAHKLAFLVSQSIHASPSNHLETVLYFL